MTALDTVPPTFVLASPEIIPLSFDITNYLGIGESIQSVSFTITDINNGLDKSASMLFEPASTPPGNQVVQIIHAAQAGHRYQLVGTLTLGTTKVLSFRTILIADF